MTGAVSIEASFAAVASRPEYEAIEPGDGLLVDLRYATTRNFTGQDLYGPTARLLLHRVAADKLRIAAALVRAQRRGEHLLVLDGLRPRSAQVRLWATVRGTPQVRYVADPARGSVHNRGLAVDLTLADESGREIDMGTPFDDFSALSEPRHEDAFVRGGRLGPVQVANRRRLRGIMEEAGFLPIASEWWHFEALPRAEAERFPIVE